MAPREKGLGVEGVEVSEAMLYVWFLGGVTLRNELLKWL